MCKIYQKPERVVIIVARYRKGLTQRTQNQCQYSVPWALYFKGMCCLGRSLLMVACLETRIYTFSVQTSIHGADRGAQ